MTLPPRIAEKPLDPEGIATSDLMWAYMQDKFPAALAAVEAVSPNLREGQRRRRLARGAGLSTYRQKAHERTHYYCWALASTGWNNACGNYKRIIEKHLAGEAVDVTAAIVAVQAYGALKVALYPGGEFYGVTLHKDVARQVERTAYSPDHAELEGFYGAVLAIDYNGMTLDDFSAAVALLEQEWFEPEEEMEMDA